MDNAGVMLGAAEAETCLLRSVFQYPKLLDKLSATLHPEDFANQHYRLIWRTLTKLQREGRLTPVDEILLINAIENEGVEVSDELSAAIGSIIGVDPNPQMAPEYARLIRESTLLRILLAEYSRGAKEIGAGNGITAALSRAAAIQEAVDGAETWLAGKSTDPFVSAGSLVDTYPTLRVPIIDGLVRAGETMNIIAPPKVGKTWLAHSIAMHVVSGTPWMGFPVLQGDVLIVDNELHGSVLASRLDTIANHMGINPLTWREHILTKTLKGNITSLPDFIQAHKQAIPPGRFQLIILDALYRFVPADRSENDNSMMAGLYNSIDQLAEASGSAVIVVHHSNRGDQSGKVVTDVGAGAGAQSRAADAHIVLRAHEEDSTYVVDGAIRSFAPISPFCLRWDFPLFHRDDSLDPELLRSPKRRGDDPDSRPKRSEWPPDKFVRTFISHEPLRKSIIIDRAIKAGLSSRLAEEALTLSLDSGLCHRWHLGGNRRAFSTAPQRDTPPLPNTKLKPSNGATSDAEDAF